MSHSFNTHLSFASVSFPVFLLSLRYTRQIREIHPFESCSSDEQKVVNFCFWLFYRILQNAPLLNILLHHTLWTVFCDGRRAITAKEDWERAVHGIGGRRIFGRW